MSKKSLKYFMRDEKEEIISAPAPDTFKDDEGNPLMLEIKILSQARIQEINENYRKRSIATNNKGVPYMGLNNEVAFKTERDSARASRHIIVEALVYPNLQDSEMMKYYNCKDLTEMPLKVFSRADEYAQVSRTIMEVLGLADKPSDDEEVNDAKN